MLSAEPISADPYYYDLDDAPQPDDDSQDHGDFVIANRWTTTASGGGLGQGDATILTWSIVPDSTPIKQAQSNESADPSGLITAMDAMFPGGSGSNLTTRSWFTNIFQKSFDRLSELTGLTFVYMAADDGSLLSDKPGVTNVRADIRIAGHKIDGAGSVLAYSYFPDISDMVIDTADTAFYSEQSNTYRGFRNVIMHEVGHGLGLKHVRSDDAAFLMEPIVTKAFDGPQLDDLLALQRNYGDPLEKDGGNDSVQRATDLGTLAVGATVGRGVTGGIADIGLAEKDFISIDDEADLDYFKFTLAGPARVTITTTPRGRSYLAGDTVANESTFDSLAQSDLQFSLIDQNGTTQLSAVNAGGVGATETLTNFDLPGAGTYFVKVSGSTTDRIQLYGLTVAASPTTGTALTADITDISPDPRNVPVTSTTVTFTLPVTGVDVSDFTLTKDGNPISLVGGSVTALSDTQYTINLGSGATTAGSYVLTLVATGSGIRTATGAPLTTNASDAFTIDLTAPTATFSAITPEVRRTAVGIVTVTFAEDVTGVDATDFSLSKNNSSVPLTGLPFAALNARQYTIDLTSFTNSVGTYALKLSAQGSNIKDRADNVMVSDVTQAWSFDTTPPTADIVDVIDPRTTPVTDVVIVFSKAVTGVTPNDFLLQRNGTTVATTTLQVSQISPNQYSINLAAFTQLSGTYTLTLVAANSGITDLAGNVLAANVTDTFTIDLSIPSGSFDAVVPDPRNVPAGVVTLNFTEDVTGVDLSDFQLKRTQGATTDSISLAGVSFVKVSNTRYTIDLTTVTGGSGSYELKIAAASAGIQDVSGNSIAADIIDTFTVDRDAPTAAWQPIANVLRTTPLTSATVRFTEAVKGVDLADFTLQRNGTAVSLAGVTVTGSGSEYIVNLGSLTAPSGSYELKLNASNSGIVDLANNPFVSPVSLTFTVDTVAPTVTLGAISSPRTTNVGVVNVTFSEAVQGVAIGAFSLSRDGSPISLAGLTLTGAANQPNFSIDLSSVTAVAGTYQFTLTASNSGIKDLAGNLFAQSTTASFVLDNVAPQADILDITPDPRRSNAGTVTIDFTEPVIGVTADDFVLTRDGAPISLAANLLTSVSSKRYTLNLSGLTVPTGFYSLTLKAAAAGISDAAGNALTDNAIDTWVVDATPPTAEIVSVTPNPRATAAGKVTVRFSEPVKGVTSSDFVLTRDGTPLALTNLGLAGLAPDVYELDLNSTFTGAVGSYVLTLVASTSGITDLADNPLQANVSSNWVVDTVAPLAMFANVNADLTYAPLNPVVLTFSQPVTGVDVSDFRLTRNNADVPLSGNVTITGSAPSATYMLNLANVTNANGDYVLTLKAANSGIANSSSKLLVSDASLVFSIDLNDAPVFKSPATINVIENEPVALTVKAFDPDFPVQTLTYSLVGGPDQSLFNIDATKGTLTFKGTPDFENPLDTDANNVFNITVGVSDGVAAKVTQAITITVEDLPETMKISPTDWPVDGKIRVLLDGTKLRAVNSANVDVVKPHAYASVTDLLVRGSNNANTLILDRSGGEIVPAGGIEFDGGISSDTLIAPSASNLQNTWVLNGKLDGVDVPNSGMLSTTATAGPVSDNESSVIDNDLALGAVTFTGVENLTGGVGRDDFLLLAGKQDGTIVDPSGTGIIRKIGGGAFELSGSSTYTIPTTVAEGNLILNGSLQSSVTVLSGATLLGNGKTSGDININNGGIISPGATGNGQLTGGIVTLAPNPGFKVIIDQANNALFNPRHTQLVATSGISIGSGTQLTVIPTSITGGAIKIIDNKSATAPIVGTFLDKPDDSTFVVGSFNATIDYQGGDGNDVTLTFVSRIDLGDAGLSADDTSAIQADDPNEIIGPSHVISGLSLGASVNGDFSYLTDGDDDNGLVSVSELRPGVDSQIVVNVSGSDGFLDAWLDLNQDHQFDESERLTLPTGTPVKVGNSTIHFSLPYTLWSGPAYLRLRLSTIGGLNSVGSAPNGEVEDHVVNLQAAVSAAVVDSTYLALPNGARVDGGTLGVDRFGTITAGVNAVIDGGVVTIHPGVYPENVLIHKNVTLDGAGRLADDVVIDPVTGDAISIQTPANAVTISDVALRGAVNGLSATSGQVLSLSNVIATNNAADGFHFAGAMTVNAAQLQSAGNGIGGFVASGVRALSVQGGSFDGISISNVGDVSLSGASITSTKAIAISANNAVTIATTLDAGAQSISVAANQDGQGSQGLSMTPDSGLATTSQSASAVSLSVNTATGGAGPLTLGAIAVGATSGVIRINSNAGVITDANAAASNLVAAAVVITGAGFGTSSDPIESSVARLEATGGAGGVWVVNSKSLMIGGVDPMPGLRALNGAIGVSLTSGSLTVAEPVSATGAITLATTDLNAAANAETLVINPNVSVTSTSSSVTLDAGDDLFLRAGSVVSAAQGATLKADLTSADSGVGATITIAGQLNSPGGTIITGGPDNDIIKISYLPNSTNVGTIRLSDAGGRNDSVRVLGTAGDDELRLTTIGPAVTSTTNRVTRGADNAEPIIIPRTFETLRLLGDQGNDIIHVQPSTFLAVTVDGQAASSAGNTISVGDTLDLDLLGNNFSSSGDVFQVQNATTAFKTIAAAGLEQLVQPGVPNSLPRRFDLNANIASGSGTIQSPTQAGFIGVSPTSLYSSFVGYGWNTAPIGLRNTSSPSTSVVANLINDGHVFTSTTNPRFITNVPNGTYQVTVDIGHRAQALDGLRIVNADTQEVLADNLATSAGKVGHVTFNATTTDGTLDLEFQDVAGARLIAVDAIDIRQAPTTGLSLRSSVEADPDGATVDAINLNGAPANSLVTIAASAGTLTGTDADPAVLGIQVLTNSTGQAVVNLRRPASGTTTVTIKFSMPTGEYVGSGMISYTGATVRHFDFNRGFSAETMSSTAAGAIGVRTNHTTPQTDGFGWSGAVEAFESTSLPNNVSPVELYRDGHQGAYGTTATFLVRAKSGTSYDFRAIIGMSGRDLDQIELLAEGKDAVIAPATSWDQFTTVAISGASDANGDGFISLRLQDLGGLTTGWAMVGLDVAEAAAGTPAGFGTANAASSSKFVGPSVSAALQPIDDPVIAPSQQLASSTEAFGTKTSRPSQPSDIDAVFSQLPTLESALP